MNTLSKKIMNMNNACKFKIDEKIINHLNFYNSKITLDLINDFLKYVKKNENNEYEFVYNEHNIKNNVINITEIKLLHPEKIKFDTVDKLEIVLEEKNENKYSQIWECKKFFEILFEKILNKNINEKHLLDFVSIILGSYVFSNVIKNENLKIVIDNNISEYYYPCKKYVYNSGSLSGTCMNDSINQVEFYDMIENVKIFAILDSSNKLFARALLWNTDKGLYLDECYIANDILQFGFYSYATRKYNVKYTYLEKNLHHFKVMINENEIINLIEPFIIKNKELPYFSTFEYFIDNENGNSYITNSKSFEKMKSGLTNLILKKYFNIVTKYMKIKIRKAYKDITDIMRNFTLISENNIEKLIDTFNVEHMNIDMEYFPVTSGNLLSFNVIPNINKIDKVQFFIEDTYKNENFTELAMNLKYKTMNVINKILKNLRYNDHTVYSYSLFRFDTARFNKKIASLKNVNSVMNKIDIIYIPFDIELMNDICYTLKNNEEKSILSVILNDFYVALNLKEKKYVLIRDVKNKFINLLKPNKLYYKFDIENIYNNKYIEKIFGNYSNLILYDIDNNTKTQNLKNEIIIFNAKFLDFIRNYLKYKEKIAELLE